MAKFDGPWESSPYEVMDREGRSVCFPPSKCSPRVWNQRARLIAAAPELLEILRMVADIDPRYPSDMKAIDSARALLARIDGESDE